MKPSQFSGFEVQSPIEQQSNHENRRAIAVAAPSASNILSSKKAGGGGLHRKSTSLTSALNSKDVEEVKLRFSKIFSPLDEKHGGLSLLEDDSNVSTPKVQSSRQKDIHDSQTRKASAAVTKQAHILPNFEIKIKNVSSSLNSSISPAPFNKSHLSFTTADYQSTSPKQQQQQLKFSRTQQEQQSLFRDYIEVTGSIAPLNN